MNMKNKEFSELLEVLEIHSDKSKITIKEINAAFRRVVLKVHPDKSCEDKEARTAEFVKLKAAYEKLKVYCLVNSPSGDFEDDVDLFLKDNFDKFNFPCENKGSFTVKIEDYLADEWQACITSLLGNPVVANNDSDIHWKLEYDGITITLHIYNKPKNKKGSKLMVQGKKQAVLCKYVFQELPKLYKSVCTNKPKKLVFMKKPVKPDVKCDKCPFKSSLLQMKMHMKTVHGPKPARASKRLLNFTPIVAKRL